MNFNSNDFNKIINYQEQIDYIEGNHDVNWESVLGNSYLSDKFLNLYFDNFKKDNISVYKYLTEEFILFHKDNLTWWEVSSNQILSNEFIMSNRDVITNEMISNMLNSKELNTEVLKSYIENTKEEINWDDISKHQELSDDFIERYNKKLNFSLLVVYQNLSEKIIEKYSERLGWKYIIMEQELSEGFIKKHIRKIEILMVNVVNLFVKNKLSEKLIKEIIKRVNLKDEKYFEDKISIMYKNIFKYQDVSEEFIESNSKMFKDNVFYISEHQNLSEGFIRKHISILYRDLIFEYQDVSEEFIDEYGNDDEHIEIILKHQKVSEEFIKVNVSERIIDEEYDELIKIKNISDENIKENIKKIDNDYLLKKSNLSINIIDWYMNNEIYDVSIDENRSIITKKFSMKRMNLIVLNQKLTKEFIIKYMSKINFNLLIKNNKIDIKVLKLFKDKLNLSLLRDKNIFEHNKRIKNIIKKEEEINYLKYYKVFNGDEKFLISNFMRKDEKIDILEKNLQEFNKSILDEKYEEMSYEEINDVIKKRVYRKERKEKERIKKLKTKLKRNIEKNNEINCDITF